MRYISSLLKDIPVKLKYNLMPFSVTLEPYVQDVKDRRMDIEKLATADAMRRIKGG